MAHCATAHEEDWAELLKPNCDVSAEDRKPGFGALYCYLCVARNSPGTAFMTRAEPFGEGGTITKISESTLACNSGYEDPVGRME